MVAKGQLVQPMNANYLSISRRKFLQSGAVAAGLLFPPLQCLAEGLSGTLPVATPARRVLVVIHLDGGNDGFNTIVPYTSAQYYRQRPTLALKGYDLLPLDNRLGLASSMQSLYRLYQAGNLAIIPCAGYDGQNASHFRSSEIWQTAYPDRLAGSGWLGRYLASSQANTKAGAEQLQPKGLALDATAAKFLALPETSGAHVSQCIDRIGCGRAVFSSAGKPQEKLADSEGRCRDTFASKLDYIARLISAGSSRAVYCLSLSGFDTHCQQRDVHSLLLRNLSDGVTAFLNALNKNGVSEKVLVLVVSEFGRRLAENEEGGTDHGGAVPVFLAGSAVRGGLYGDYPVPTSGQYGLGHTVDFRTIYATILERWLDADSCQVLGCNLALLPIL